MARAIQVRMLGEFSVSCGEQALRHFRTQKTAALLAYLCYHPGRPHLRESLCELFWPQVSRDTAGASLSTALWWLRRELATLSPCDAELLRADRVSVALGIPPSASDAARFEAALDRVESGNVEALTEACSLYTGELLPGFFDEWVLVERRRLALRHFQADRELIQNLLGAGKSGEALKEALRLVALEPHSEKAHHELICTYLAIGQPATAWSAYRELEGVLLREFATQPSPATQALLNETVTKPSPLPDAQTPVESGALFQPPGGAVPIGSPHYIARRVDQQLVDAIDQSESIVLVKGSLQMGKSSLLARGLAQARSAGARVLSIDLEAFSPVEMDSAARLYLGMANRIAVQLNPDAEPVGAWPDERSPGSNFERYVRREVLTRDNGRLVWALDGIDRLFSCPFGAEIFRLLRSWHNARALDPNGPWTRLTLIIAYATEVSQFIKDPNQSPFNVGTHLVLEGFTAAQVEQMNERLLHPLRGAREIQAFVELVGGHPYLAHRGLYHLKTTRCGLAQLDEHADRDDGPFGHHLRSLLAVLNQDDRLFESVRRLITREVQPSPEVFYRLQTAGILTGDREQTARLRCKLYERYFARHLGVATPKAVSFFKLK